MIVNGISGPHRACLKAGSYAFIIGNDTLSYAPESIFEHYYRMAIPYPLPIRWGLC